MPTFNSFYSTKTQGEYLTDEYYLTLAIEAAKHAKSQGEVAIGAVLVMSNKHYLVEHDTIRSDFNYLSTAGLNVVKKAIETMPHNVSGGILYTTVEPDACTVLSACANGIREFIFGAYDFKNGFSSSSKSPLKIELMDISYKGGVLAEECFQILPKELKEVCSVEILSKEI